MSDFSSQVDLKVVEKVVSAAFDKVITALTRLWSHSLNFVFFASFSKLILWFFRVLVDHGCGRLFCNRLTQIGRLYLHTHHLFAWVVTLLLLSDDIMGKRVQRTSPFLFIIACLSEELLLKTSWTEASDCAWRVCSGGLKMTLSFFNVIKIILPVGWVIQDIIWQVSVGRAVVTKMLDIDLRFFVCAIKWRRTVAWIFLDTNFILNDLIEPASPCLHTVLSKMISEKVFNTVSDSSQHSRLSVEIL